MFQILYQIRDHKEPTSGSQRRDDMTLLDPIARHNDLDSKDVTGGASSGLVRWVGRKVKAVRTALGSGRMRLL